MRHSSDADSGVGRQKSENGPDAWVDGGRGIPTLVGGRVRSTSGSSRAAVGGPLWAQADPRRVVVDVDDSYLTICSKLTEHIGVFMSSVPNFGVCVICAIVFRCLGHSKNVHDDDDDDDLHCESKKTRHQTVAHDFTKY